MAIKIEAGVLEPKSGSGVGTPFVTLRHFMDDPGLLSGGERLDSDRMNVLRKLSLTGDGFLVSGNKVVGLGEELVEGLNDAVPFSGDAVQVYLGNGQKDGVYIADGDRAIFVSIHLGDG